MAHQAHDAIDVHSPLVLHDAAASPHGFPDLGSSSIANTNNNSSNNLTTTAIPYEDSPEVPHSPSFGNNNATFAYTPNPNEEYTDKQLGAGGALHSSSSDVEYGAIHSQNKRTLIGGNLFQGKRKWYWIGGGIVLLAVIVGATVGVGTAAQANDIMASITLTDQAYQQRKDKRLDIRAHTFGEDVGTDRIESYYNGGSDRIVFKKSFG